MIYIPDPTLLESEDEEHERRRQQYSSPASKAYNRKWDHQETMVDADNHGLPDESQTPEYNNEYFADDEDIIMFLVNTMIMPVWKASKALIAKGEKF